MPTYRIAWSESVKKTLTVDTDSLREAREYWENESYQACEEVIIDSDYNLDAEINEVD